MNIRLRLAGLGLLGISALAIHWLIAVAHHAGQHSGGWSSAIAFGLALTAFLTGSAGAMLAATGAHIFDPVILSERWRRR